MTSITTTFQRLHSVAAASDENGTEIVLIGLGDPDAADPSSHHVLWIDDARRLVVDTLVALASHGDATAQTVLDEYFAPTDCTCPIATLMAQGCQCGCVRRTAREVAP